MKFDSFNLKRRPAGANKLPPLRSLKEMADEFGVSMVCLKNTIQRSKLNPPAPVNRSTGVVKNVWYEPNALRAWWRRHQEAKDS